MSDDIRFIEAHRLAKILQLDSPIVFLDVETTGPYPAVDRVIQLGFIRIDKEEVTEKELLFSVDGGIPAEATKIHGITNDQLNDKPKFSQQAKQLAEVLDADICGYNGDFDIRMLQAEFDRSKVRWNHGLLIDPFKVFVAEEKRDLTAAVKFYLGEDHTNAHTALADTRAALRIMLAQLQKYDHLPKTVQELNHHLFGKIPEGYLDPKRRLAMRDGEVVLAFGVHTGKRVKDQVPESYINWLLRTDFSDDVKELIKKEIQ